MTTDEVPGVNVVALDCDGGHDAPMESPPTPTQPPQPSPRAAPSGIHNPAVAAAPFVYLDHNASAPPCAAALSVIAEWVRGGALGNPSSRHWPGQRARASLERARDQVAAGMGVRAEDLIWTSGATEADDLGIAGAPQPAAIAWAAIEHPAIAGPCRAVRDRGAVAIMLPTRDDGRLDVERAQPLLAAAPRPLLCVVAAVHHELGTVQPLAALRAAMAPGDRMHVDAAQAAGRIALAAVCGIADSVAISGHKCGGVAGAGALWLRPGQPLRARVEGAQERGLSGGTENLLGALALGAAATEWSQRAAAHADLRPLRDALRRGVADAWPGALRQGPRDPAEETGHVLSVALPGADAQALVEALDVEGVAVSAGAACSSGSGQPSPAIAALHGEARARQTLRFSLGVGTGPDDIAAACAALSRIAARARR